MPNWCIQKDHVKVMQDQGSQLELLARPTEREKRKRGWKSMAVIKTVETGLYRIPLTVTLSDSTHGEIAAFELVTCRVRDSDGAEGTGYTYTVGRNGGAAAYIPRLEIQI